MGARELLADLTGEGLSVTAAGDRLVIRPASKLTDNMRAALREVKPDLLALLAATDAEIARRTLRRDRLIRWGYSTADAGALADRLTRRDREADARVCCADCRNYRPGRCGNHRRAGLLLPALGRDLASLLQHCPGFEAVLQPATSGRAALASRGPAVSARPDANDPAA